MFSRIPKNVFLLGLVSFFNDLSSEMIYPIVPIFLTTILHTSVPIVGFIEGFVEATAAITKYLFGTYSDYLRRRKLFVVGGYSLSAVSKVLIGLAYAWPMVLVARFIDRFGKGMRTAVRDSLLLENATVENKGFIFGFHRAFDSLGAVFGPLLALGILYLMKDNLRQTFFIAFIPATVAVVLLVFFVKEKRKIVIEEKKEFIKINWKTLQPKLKLFLAVSFLFSLGNSSDVFLLLYARSLGLSTTLVVLAYVLYNVSQTIFATPAGSLSDKIGAKKVFAGGLVVFALVYFSLGIIKDPFWMWLIFPVYGIYIAATDGISKAYISEFIEKRESGTFFGAYYTLTAVGTFIASLLGGLLWNAINPQATFFFGGIMSLLALLIFVLFNRKAII